MIEYIEDDQPIINLGHGTVCMEDVETGGNMGIAFSFACKKEPLGKNADTPELKGEPIDTKRVAAIITFSDMAAVVNFESQLMFIKEKMTGLSTS